MLPNFQKVETKNFPISRLNNYDPTLKKHRGSIVSMQSSLQSIEENEDNEQEEQSASSIQEKEQPKPVEAGIVKRLSNQSSASKNHVSINSILNFGHGRRNNLVKLAE